jgi:hypothetical protein
MCVCVCVCVLCVCHQDDENSDSDNSDSHVTEKTKNPGSGNTIFPRRKAGQNARTSAKPVILNESTLSPMFSLPLHEAALRLGISGIFFCYLCLRVRGVCMCICVFSFTITPPASAPPTPLFSPFPASATSSRAHNVSRYPGMPLTPRMKSSHAA